MPEAATGQYYVRPPTLKFREMKTTPKYTEYKVQTFRTPKLSLIHI